MYSVKPLRTCRFFNDTMGIFLFFCFFHFRVQGTFSFSFRFLCIGGEKVHHRQNDFVIENWLRDFMWEGDWGKFTAGGHFWQNVPLGLRVDCQERILFVASVLISGFLLSFGHFLEANF